MPVLPGWCFGWKQPGEGDDSDDRDDREWPVELQTKVHTKVRNNGEGPF